MNEQVEQIIEKLLYDFNNVWTNHKDYEKGVYEYAKKIIDLIENINK
tara:strand:- start:21 stop:161 length:141 start_codon:yes stop_codon:yes gene_type:complete